MKQLAALKIKAADHPVYAGIAAMALILVLGAIAHATDSKWLGFATVAGIIACVATGVVGVSNIEFSAASYDSHRDCWVRNIDPNDRWKERFALGFIASFVLCAIAYAVFRAR